MAERVDFVVIGAGMAGVSAAAELAASGSVVIVERESAPGAHSTGRSAALYSQIYGNAPIRALSRASRAFLAAPPEGFAPAPLLQPRGTLFVALAGREAALDAWRAEPDVTAGTEPWTLEQARARVPILAGAPLAAAAYEQDSHDVDVDALLQGYLRQFRARGGRLVPGAEAVAIERRGNRWHVTAGDRAFEADVVVNAAGAWADRVARLAGVREIGLVPKRRTALLVAAPEGHAIAAWPMVIDCEESLYFKYDAGRLLISPADETPVEPCDAQPDELDVAIAVDRYEQLTGQTVRRVLSSWAGLRSFVADRAPAIGFDPEARGFFWLCGQGGYGIQTAPAAARLAAHLATGRAPPADLVAHGVDVAALDPARLRD
jgi:D-arginine dehydrogenase